MQHHSQCTPNTVAALGPTTVVILFTIVSLIVNVAFAMLIIRLRKRLKQYEAASGVASNGSDRPSGIPMCDCKQNYSKQPMTNPTLQVLADNADNASSLQSTTSTLSVDSRCAKRGPGVFPRGSGDPLDCSDRASVNKTKARYEG